MASKKNQQLGDEGNSINREGTNIPNESSNNKKAQNQSSKASSTRSNNSNKKNKASPAKTNSVNRTSRRKPDLLNDMKNNDLFQKQQSEHNAPSSNLSDNKAPKKRSKMKKVLDKFTNIIKRPTKTIKSSLGMNNQKTTSHVDKLRNQSKKSTRGR